MPAGRHPAHTRPRARAAVLLAALVAVGASSCSLLPFGAGSKPSTQTLADGSGFLVSAPSSSGMTAIVSGRLALIGDDCVGLRMSPEESAVLAFPHGTHPSDDGRTIVLPGGVEAALGDAISAGGGYLTLDGVPDAFDRWPDAPSGCAGATYLTSIHDVRLDGAPQG